MPTDSLTFRDILALLGHDLPDSSQISLDQKFDHFTAPWAFAVENSLHFSSGNTLAQTDKLVASGIRAFIESKQQFTSDGEQIPTYIVEDPIDCYVRLMRTLKQKHRVKTLAITGTTGKTTCKDMIQAVCATNFKTHFSKGNANVLGRVGTTIQRLPSDAEFYIQETGAVEPGIIEKAARMLEPSAALITNIGFAHIGEYGGKQDNVLADKLSLDKYLPDDGVFFVNWDDEILRNKKFIHTVISYSLASPESDYWAESIREVDAGVNFDIVERQTGSRTQARLHVAGKHNVLNAVAAFAVGRWAGIEPEKIVRGLASFRTTGTRQNLRMIGGQKVLVDCFNASELAILSTAETLESLSIKADGRRVYVIGDIPRLGESSESIHRQVGRDLAAYQSISKFFLFGQNMKFTAEELKFAGRDVYHTLDRNQLNSELATQIRFEDVVAFKAGAPTAMALTVDALYGTSYLYSDPYYWKSNKRVVNDIIYRDIKEFGVEAKALTDHSNVEAITIGGNISGSPVVLLGARAFQNSNLGNVIIESPVRSIGFRAFHNSLKLSSIKLPSSLKVIGRGAFNGCKSLTSVELSEGLTTIQEGAFARCANLRKLLIPRSVRTVEPGAFLYCNRIVVECYRDSPVAELLRQRLPKWQFKYVD